jgi:integrase
MTLRIRLPSADSPEFAASIERCRSTAGIPEHNAPAAGSIAALCHAFRADLSRRRTKRGPLSPRTVENYRRYADRIEREHGHRMMAQIKPKHCYIIQDGLSDEPATANNYMAVLRLILAMACKFGWVDTNAAAGVPALPIGEHEPWPARVIEAAIAAARPMSRLALVTYLCSGQRGGEVIRMQHGWHDRRIMQLVQSKTDKSVAIPMHPRWIAEIDATPKKSVTILYDRQGKPFREVEMLRERINDLLLLPTVQAAIAESVALEKMPAGVHLVPHGLRKNAACHLKEQGLSDEEVGALCGMTPATVAHYSKKKSVYLIAKRIADRITGASIVGLSGPRSGRARK